MMDIELAGTGNHLILDDNGQFGQLCLSLWQQIHSFPCSDSAGSYPAITFVPNLYQLPLREHIHTIPLFPHTDFLQARDVRLIAIC